MNSPFRPALSRFASVTRSSVLAVAAILLTVLLTAPPSSAFAQDAETLEKARGLVQQMMAETHAPGVAVSIGIKGQIVWSEGFGYADVEQKVPVIPATTRFRIGSVSKPMTAVAVARLYEDGRLDLDEPVQTYVPSFPVKRQGTVTTRLLAGHLAGIRHYRGDEFLSTRHFPTVKGGLAIFKDDPLLHAPGSAYSYSSYGWNLISAVVESASGEQFLSYMDENVFDRAGMTQTVADQVSQLIENRTAYYEFTDGRLQNAPHVDNSYKWAGGGFLSTSDDIVRFGFAHLDPKYLKSETVSLFWTSQRTTDGEDTGYGIGWTSRKDGNGRIYVGHTGGSVGGSTSFFIYPDTEVVVVIIANMTSTSFGSLSGQLAELFMP
jgi:serine beta-lactamase-like protein LACTB